jgi:hypothetical protein
MKYHAPQLILVGSSITTIQGGDVGISLSMKSHSSADGSPNEGYSFATTNAYQADE